MICATMGFILRTVGECRFASGEVEVLGFLFQMFWSIFNNFQHTGRYVCAIINLYKVSHSMIYHDSSIYPLATPATLSTKMRQNK